MAQESESSNVCACPQDQGGAEEGAVRSSGAADEHGPSDPSDALSSISEVTSDLPSSSSGPAASEPEKSSASRDGRAEAAGPTTSMVHAPLHKLWELERLEMARQLWSFRGELRGLKPGEQTTFREEHAAKQELQSAMRELILAAGPDDRSTLEALLRAVEAGHEDSMSSPVVRQFLSASRRRAQAAAQPETQHPRMSFLDAPAARVAALVIAVVALGALRRLRLVAPLRGALAALAGRWRNLWGQHLADTPAGSVMRRLHSRSLPPQPLYAHAPSLDGFNALARGSKRSLWRPQSWFGPGLSDPAASAAAAAAAAAAGLPSTPEGALGAEAQGHHSLVAPLIASGPSDLNFFQVYPVAEAATPWRPRGGIDPPSVGSRSFPTLSSALLASRHPSGGAAVDLCSIPRAGIIQQQQPAASPRSGEGGQHEEEQQGLCLTPNRAPSQAHSSSSSALMGSQVRWSMDLGSSSSTGNLHQHTEATSAPLPPGSQRLQPSLPVLKADLLTAGTMDDLRALPIRHCHSSSSPAAEITRPDALPDEAPLSSQDIREDPEGSSGPRRGAAGGAPVAEGAACRGWPERDEAAEASAAARPDELEMEETDLVGTLGGDECEGEEPESASSDGSGSARKPSRPHLQPPSLPRRPCEALVA